MLRRVSVVCLLLAAPLMVAGQRRGRKYTPPPPTSKITVIVTKAANGKPVEDAAVVFHPIKEGKDDGNMELKTDEEGKAVLDVIPIGDTVRLQIIKIGYETYGADYEVDGPTKEIAIKLLPPGRQYSIYEKHSGGQVGGHDEAPEPSSQPH